MRKAILLYNPQSGRRRDRRIRDVQKAMAVFQQAGVAASAEPTLSANGAAEQVRQAISDGCDTVLACGGDGTVHDVLQGLAGTTVALGVVPLGTANAFAHDLGIPLTPAAAARALLMAQPRRVAVGKVTYQDRAGKCAFRFFTVTAGIGVDAHLFYDLQPLVKRRLGMMAYYAMATRLWLLHKMRYFNAEVFGHDGKPMPTVDVTQILAVRIRNFGGILRELAPGASLDSDKLRVVLFRTKNRLTILRYIIRGVLATPWRANGIELVHASQVSCRPRSRKGESAYDPRIFVEADGELLGTIPADISIVPDALTVLSPNGHSR